MKPTSIFIACPVYDAPHAAYMQSMLSVMGAKSAHAIQFHPIYNVAETHHARGILASIFLAESDCEWLLMTDADMQFTLEDVERLLGRGRKLIGGLYYKRVQSPTPIPVLNTLDGKPFDPAAFEVQEVREVGTGFMLIHRGVLEQIRAACPHIEFVEGDSGKTRWNFFEIGVFDRRFLTGDWSICNRWRKLGGQVFVDCARRLPHHGKAVY